MRKNQEAQRLFKVYKQQSGITEVDPLEFAKWMRDRGWKVPVPPDPMDLLAKQLKDAICEEVRRDAKTGQPYKANLSFSTEGTSQQGTFWKLVDVDEAPRKIVHKCLVQRREQSVNDIYQMELIQDHWNNIHPDEEPIKMELDYGPDMQWKKNGPSQNAA